MNTNKLQRTAKRNAYAEKNEKKQRSIINWIFVVLILLGVLYAIYSMLLFS
mgnify:FL=1